MKKKIISVALAIIMLMSTFVLPAYAADKESDDKVVGNMYLCSNWSGLPSLGHIWVYFENTSGAPLKVGVYTCGAGEGVSIGAFGLTRSDGSGVYYNIESYCGYLYGMGRFISIKTSVSKSELERISNFISGYNFWDPVVFNCAFFAITCWNLAGGRFIFPINVFPAFTRTTMQIYGAQSDLEMYFPTRARVYKQKGIGKSAKLVEVSSGSVDTVPG